MQRKFFTNLILLLFLNLLIKPFWVLFIDRGVQNAVGHGAYGEYFALFNFTFLFNILLDLGITNYNNRSIAQNDVLLTKYFTRIFIFKLLLGFLFLAVSVAAGLVIDYSADQIKLLVFLIFNQFLISLIMYLRSNIAGLHLFRSDSLISVLDRAIMIACCSVLLWGNVTGVEFTIHLFVYIQTAAYALTALAAFLVLLPRIERLSFRWDGMFIRAVVKKSMPYAVLVLLMSFYNRVDTVMLERMLPDGAAQSGVYAAGFRLLDAANMIAFLFAVLLLPIFSRMLKQREPVEQLLNLSARLLLVPAIVVAAGSFFYGRELMSAMYRDEVEAMAAAFRLLMFCFVPISVTYLFGTLLTANGNLRQLNIMAASGMALNLALNLVLIPKYQAQGSAAASLVTQALTALAQVIIAQRVFRFRMNHRLLFTMGLFGGGVLLLGHWSRALPYEWHINLAVMALLSAALAFLFRLLSVQRFIGIIRNG